jgi:5-methylcytosine-specific restriction endonuclease McrA
VPLRICSERKCGQVVHYRGRCRDHARRRNAETRSQNRGVYNSKRWQITRSRYLFANPLCARCGDVATDVHHKVDIQAGGDPWDMSGLEALCHSCHSRITRANQLA